METGNAGGVLSKRQRKLNARRIKAERAKEPKQEPAQRPEQFRAKEPANDDTMARRFHVETDEDGDTKLVPYDQRLSRLEHLESRGVITPRQCDAGKWIAYRWEAYFTPGVSSGIEDHAPGWIPADPLARWVRGQRATDRYGKPRTPPPTFRPKRPAADRRAHDGWSLKRCDALQEWVRANRLLTMLQPYDRSVLVLVALEGCSLEEAHMRIRGVTRRPGGKQVERVKRALIRALEFIADETAPAIREIAA